MGAAGLPGEGRSRGLLTIRYVSDRPADQKVAISRVCTNRPRMLERRRRRSARPVQGWNENEQAAEHVVVVYDYDVATGSIENRQVFAELPEEGGAPDGLTVDSDGFVWSARWPAGEWGDWTPVTKESATPSCRSRWPAVAASAARISMSSTSPQRGATRLGKSIPVQETCSGRMSESWVRWSRSSPAEGAGKAFAHSSSQSARPVE